MAVAWQTPPPMRVGSKLDFVARFLGRTLAYTYEVVEYEPGERLVMRTAEGPFPMETAYLFEAVDAGHTRMRLRNRGEPVGFAAVAQPLIAAAMRRANTKDLAGSSSCWKRRGDGDVHHEEAAGLLALMLLTDARRPALSARPSRPDLHRPPP